MKNRIAEIRKKTGLSQKQTAIALQIKISTYCQYETGKRQADYNTLKKIAAFFNTTIDELLDNNVINNNESNTDFGTILRNSRKKKGLLQSEIADAIKIHRTTYTKYETNQAEPSFSILIQLCKLLDISLDNFIKGESSTPDILNTPTSSTTIHCVLCNSHDMTKKDDYIICDQCGCKYPINEAKKLLST